MSREMKYSGVEWLGDIPKNWDVDRIKRAILSIKGGIWGDEAVGDENDVDCVRIADFERKYYRVGDVDFTKRNIPIIKQRDYLLKYGDLLIEKSGGGDKTPVGFVALFDKQESAVYSNFTAKLTVNQNEADSNFMRYLFAALYEQGISFRSIKQTTGIQNIDMKAYLDEKVGYPPINTQRKIAKILDFDVIEINSLIEKTKSTIEDYNLLKQSIITEAVTKGLGKNVEMKDSGIEWIGSIPSHWNVSKLRYLGSLQNGISKSSDFFGKGTPFVSYSDVYRNYELPPDVSGLVEATEKDKITYSVQEGDVFFTRTSETIEEIGFSSTCLKTIPDATFAGFLIRFRPFSKSSLQEKFTKYYFRSDIHRRYFVKEMNLVTRASLSQGLLKNLTVLLPPFEEQVLIGEFLERKCHEIEVLINRKMRIIEELEAYKKSLIYEYVTGKKEVE